MAGALHGHDAAARARRQGPARRARARPNANAPSPAVVFGTRGRLDPVDRAISDAHAPTVAPLASGDASGSRRGPNVFATSTGERYEAWIAASAASSVG